MEVKYRKAWLATAIWFALNGLNWATFASRMPDIKHRLHISNGQLGTTLFVASIGALFAVRIAGRLSAKYGSGPMMMVGAMGLIIADPVMASMPNAIVFAASLFCMSFSAATMDLAMNAQAVTIEHATGKLIMGRLHGMWSLGSMIGGAIGGLLSTWRLNLQLQGFLVSGFIGLVVLIFRRHPLAGTEDKHEFSAESKSTKHPLIFYVLGLIGLCACIAEGASLDWGAVLLRDRWHAGAFVAALPFVFFQGGMVVGRFSADSVTEKFGRAPVLLFAALAGGLGGMTGLSIGGPFGIVLGWVLLGVGVSAVFPMMVSLSAVIVKRDYEGVVPQAQAVATVAGIAYAAFMFGPPIIGFVSELASLRAALYIPSTLMLFIIVGSRIAKRAEA